jgi:protein ImuB
LLSAPPPNPPNPLHLQSALCNQHSLYACLYHLPDLSAPQASSAIPSLITVAQEFSPRYERHRDDLVSVDVSGLTRLLGPARTIGEEMRREAAARGMRANVAVAGTRMAAMLLAQARPGLTVIEPGAERSALAPLPLALIEKSEVGSQKLEGEACLLTSDFVLRTSKRWGLKTLGDLASLPAADLVSRLGRSARTWQAIARGEDVTPLVPMVEAERFDASLDLEWPIAELEPLSFVLTRLLEPLSTRLERRDRGAAVLHVLLRLVTRETTARRLELPTPMRDVRALRTLALLDLEAHPAEAAIDRVTIVIDPTPGRVVQHTLYTRARPTPEQLSTLLARLGALMGQDRFGAPVSVDTERPGAFAMAPFATDHDAGRNRGDRCRQAQTERPHGPSAHEPSAISHQPLMSALRRCRQPVPARVAVMDGRPVRVTTDRRGFPGGTVVHCAGPWRTSGHWWELEAGGAGQAGAVRPVPPIQPIPPVPPWDRDEWDVSLGDGAGYRVFRDRETDRWFIDAIVD